jgi:hypothetical protein
VKLYNFSIYAKRRDERRAAQAVADVVGHINDAGSVVELKEKMNAWLVLHREVVKKVG